jgi:hypothetical protein
MPAIETYNQDGQQSRVKYSQFTRTQLSRCSRTHSTVKRNMIPATTYLIVVKREIKYQYCDIASWESNRIVWQYYCFVYPDLHGFANRRYDRLLTE